MWQAESMNLAMNALCIVAPAVGFISQIVKGKILYSPLLSFLIILSNIFRIYYWHLEPFEFYLVIQSVCIIILHNLLIAMYDEELSYYEARLFKTPLTRKLYKRRGLFVTHLQIMISAGIGFYMLRYVISPKAVLLISKYANFVLDTFIGVFQYLLTKYDRRSETLSLKRKKLPKGLLFFWVFGDIVKCVFFIRTNAPPQIVLSACFQFLINCILFRQNQ